MRASISGKTECYVVTMLTEWTVCKTSAVSVFWPWVLGSKHRLVSLSIPSVVQSEIFLEIINLSDSLSSGRLDFVTACARKDMFLKYLSTLILGDDWKGSYLEISRDSAGKRKQFGNIPIRTDKIKTKQKGHQFSPGRDMRWWQRLIANDTVQFRCNNSFVLSSVSAAGTSDLRFHLWTLNPQVCGFSSSLAGIPLQTRERLPGIFHFQQLFQARCSETNHFLPISVEQRFHILVIVPRVSL